MITNTNNLETLLKKRFQEIYEREIVPLEKKIETLQKKLDQLTAENNDLKLDAEAGIRYREMAAQLHRDKRRIQNELEKERAKNDKLQKKRNQKAFKYYLGVKDDEQFGV